MNLKHSMAVFAAISLFIESAGATTMYLQAASGHLHLGSGTANYVDEFTDTAIRIIDGRSISFGGNQFVEVIRTWDVPIPITSTNVNWSTRAFASAPGAAIFNHRICTFNSFGSFSACGATVAASTTSTASVPTDGSAYSQSFLSRLCPPTGCSTPTFFHVRASDS